MKKKANDVFFYLGVVLIPSAVIYSIYECFIDKAFCANAIASLSLFFAGVAFIFCIVLGIKFLPKIMTKIFKGSKRNIH